MYWLKCYSVFSLLCFPQLLVQGLKIIAEVEQLWWCCVKQGILLQLKVCPSVCFFLPSFLSPSWVVLVVYSGWRVLLLRAGTVWLPRQLMATAVVCPEGPEPLWNLDPSHRSTSQLATLPCKGQLSSREQQVLLRQSFKVSAQTQI